MACFEENACYNFFFCKENDTSVKGNNKITFLKWHGH